MWQKNMERVLIQKSQKFVNDNSSSECHSSCSLQAASFHWLIDLPFIQKR